jgi:HSP20 family protein
MSESLIRINEWSRQKRFAEILAGSDPFRRSEAHEAPLTLWPGDGPTQATMSGKPIRRPPALGRLEKFKAGRAEAAASATVSPTPRRSIMAEAATKLPVKKFSAPAKAEDWAPFESLRREIDRLFDDFRPFDWRLPSRMLGFEVPRMSRAEWPVAPAMDIIEKEDAYEITAELPGLDDKNIEIKLSNNTLTIMGEKSEEKEDQQKNFYLSERRYGSFQRSFPLPDGVDADKIDAKFSKGVLTVKLPKTAAAKKAEKKITVQTA